MERRRQSPRKQSETNQADGIDTTESQQEDHSKENLTHYCHATGCKCIVPPAIFMCRAHWYKLPKQYRNMILSAYRPGQEVTKTPSALYMAAAKKAIGWMARAEGRSEELEQQVKQEVKRRDARSI